ncbi:hypothetical protein OFB63_30275, partial [Escherichia coli]|nr:hypothetical protein [Escherichia coli]
MRGTVRLLAGLALLFGLAFAQYQRGAATCSEPQSWVYQGNTIRAKPYFKGDKATFVLPYDPRREVLVLLTPDGKLSN